MSAAPWFHLAMLPDAGATVAIDRAEARHALGARRLSTGDAISIFDGRGGVADARLRHERGRDGSLAVEVLAIRQVPRPALEVTLATAVPKGDRWSTLLEMSAQLGAAAIIPLDCERSTISGASINRQRAGRIVLEACKQSRRAWAPRIDDSMEPCDAARFHLARAAAVFVAHPDPSESNDGLAALRAIATGTIVLMIGPEGGFSAREVDHLRAVGATLVSMGDATLRIETAAAAMLTLAQIR